MLSFLKAFFSSLFPDYGSLRKRGFETRIFNGDLVLTKTYKEFTFNLHQAVEPHNSKFGKFIDFDIEGVCFILHWSGESLDKSKAIDFMQKKFAQVHIRDQWVFAQLDHVKWEDRRTLECAIECDDFFQVSY